MENKTPKQISFLVAISIAFIAILVLIGLIYVLPISFNFWYIIGFGMVLFAISYFIVLNVIEKFLYQKIKLIYKTISSSKLNDDKTNSENKKNLLLKNVEHDVVEWVRTNQEEMTQLKKMESFRRDFLGNVSHELKTPLFNIQGYIETLLDGGMRDHQINIKYLKKAASNVDRLTAIVDDLSLISEIEHDNLQLKLEVFDIGKLISEVMYSLEEQAQKNKIKLDFKTGYPTSYKVLADKQKIIQVLVNLFVNSIKYGKEGGQTLVGCYDMEDNILIEISDDGMGIDEQHLPRLFERFYRVDSNRSRIQGGTGLGLAIVKHIMEAHQQTVNVRSTLNKGSSFSFTLKKAD